MKVWFSSEKTFDLSSGPSSMHLSVAVWMRMKRPLSHGGVHTSDPVDLGRTSGSVNRRFEPRDGHGSTPIATV